MTTPESAQLYDRLHYLGPYLPTDRFRAIVEGREIDETAVGAVLIADISGYTPLTTRLMQEYGPQQASEELQKKLNPMFEALAGQVFHKGGSVIRFLGDGFIAWFDEFVPFHVENSVNATVRAVVAATEMMHVMQIFRDLELRVAVGYGVASRWVIGDPVHGLVDIMVGKAIDDATQAAQPYKEPGVVMSVSAVTQVITYPEVEVEVLPRGECRIRTVDSSLVQRLRTYRWPAWNLTIDLQDAVDQVSRYVPSVIQNQISRGYTTFVNELRYATPVFIQFGGIDYDNDDHAYEKLDGYLKALQAVILDTGGQVISVEVGDKGSVVYVLHGAPISYRNDTVRAIQTALKIQLLKLQHPAIAWQSIGIARGVLYTGTVGGEVRHEYTAIGDSTNLAARLMVAAQEDQILVTERVRFETENDFDWEDLDPVELKGREALVAIAQPLRRRYDTKAVRMFGKLVGRDTEVQDFRHWVADMKEGRPQVVQITGQTGVGKSYMAAEFMNIASSFGVRTTSGNCLSLGNQIPFLPWRNIIQTLLDLRDNWTNAKKVEVIHQYIAQHYPALEARWPLFAELLDIPIPDEYQLAVMDGHRRLKAIESATIDLIWEVAMKQPICILIEDVHWLDEVSESLLIELIKEMNVQPAPVMLILVHRPADDIIQPERLLRTLENQQNHHHINLAEIDENSVGQIIEERLGAASPPELTRFIYDKTRGNTFFVQEMVDTLRESQAVQILGKEVFIIKDLATINLPRTILEMAQSRIDSLSEDERLILKVAAVIGPQFNSEIIQRSMPVKLDDAILDRMLKTLVKREFLRWNQDEDVYSFQHAIMQEVTYNSLLSRQRQQLHQIVGTAIEEMEPESWEKLAFHFANTEDSKRALHYLLKAGRDAQHHHANASALEYFAKALPLIDDDEVVFDTISDKIRVLFRIGNLEGVERGIEEARAIMERVNGDRIDWQALLGSFQARYNYQVSAWNDAIAEAQRVLTYAETTNNLLLMWHSYEVLRDSYRQLNNLTLVATITARMQVVASQMDDSFRTMQLLLDDLDELHSRYPEQAELGLNEAYQEIITINNPWNEARYWQVMGRVHERKQDFLSAMECYQKQLAVCQQIGNQRLEGHALNSIGLLLLQLGQFTESTNYIQWAYRLLHQAEERSGEANCLASLGLIAQRYRGYDEAVAYLSRGLMHFEELNSLPDVGRLAFLLGNVWIDKKEYEKAQANFERAIAISEATDDTLSYSEFQLGLAHCRLVQGDLAAVEYAVKPALEAMLVQFPYQWIDLGLAYWRLIGILRALNEHDDANVVFGSFQNFIQRTFQKLETERARQDLIERVVYHRELVDTRGYPQTLIPTSNEDIAD